MSTFTRATSWGIATVVAATAVLATTTPAFAAAEPAAHPATLAAPAAAQPLATPASATLASATPASAALSSATAASALGSATPASAPADATPGVTHAQNPSVPDGAAWTEAYFPSSAPSSNGDAVQLHADVLRPANLAPGEKTPVIMSIGPYFSHSGSNVDTHPAHAGPSTRFTDLIDGAQLMTRGYTFVYVDLRGFGASTGCIDWLGPGEQADVVSAVEWAAQQSWSTGAVGLYGKSYDGSTGLAGIDLQPAGLKAVVAQEPSWSGYDYLITNDISRPQQVETPLSYLVTASLPGVDHAYQQDGYDIPADTPQYLQNAAYEKTHPECGQTIMAETKEMSRQSDFWRSRDLPANVGGSAVPLMFTQGLTEQNTKPEGMQQFLDNHTGEVRAWLGPWDHVRGNELDKHGTLQMGRTTWFDEVMAFYDAHLKEQTTQVSSYFYIQDNFGQWRLQDAWGTTAKTAVIPLRSGSYTDTGRGTQIDDPVGPNPNPLAVRLDDSHPDPAPDANDKSVGVLTLSHSLRTDVRLTGTPVVELNTQGAGNTMVQLWDVAPDRSAVIVNENVSTLSADGVTRFTLLSMDWTLRAGHRLAVTVDTIEWGYWNPKPSGSTVVVTGGAVSVPVESTAADVPAAGGRAPFLDEFLTFAALDYPVPAAPETFTLSAALGRISSAASTVVAGTAFEVAGAGYDPGASVALAGPGGLAVTMTTDAQGAFRVTLRLPEAVAAGPATLTAVAEDGGQASLDLTVVAAGTPTLAATGTASGGPASLAAGAALALLLGASLSLLRRRTRTRRA
ncbi:CocE/NonD family hydrolase [Herbiconiux sp. 11R-BC]|uniref:CocE/NonD family hydrolase n=1 Tax=Herbiconiux sp. 11R-BC TaxID=3111637 RepID=UPI003C090604